MSYGGRGIDPPTSAAELARPPLQNTMRVTGPWKEEVYLRGCLENIYIIASVKKKIEIVPVIIQNPSEIREMGSICLKQTLHL